MMQNMEHLPQQDYVQASERMRPQRRSLLRWLSLLWKRFFYGPERPELNVEVERELEEGEKVLWLGRPGKPPMLAAMITALILSSIAVLLFLLGIIGLLLGWGPAIAGPFSSAIYIAFFAFLTTAITRSRQHKLQRVRYLITDQRVVIITVNKKDRTVEGYYDIDQLQRTERPDGTGNLTFVTPSGANTQQSNASFTGKFIEIANVRDVETLLKRTFRQKRES